MAEETPSSSGSTGGTGLDPKVSSLLAYLLGIVGGIIFYAISKDSYIRFHAMQSILFSVAIVIIYAIFTVIAFIPFLWIIGWIGYLVYLGIVAVWILLMVKAYGGEQYKLPIIGSMAEKYSR